MKNFPSPRRILTLLLTSIVASPALQALESGELWTTFNLTEYKKGPWETRSHAELRFPELEYLSYVRLSQKFYYKVDKHLTFGLHPTYESGRKNEDADWKYTLRLDLEANFAFKLGDISVKTRNRYEIRRKEGRGGEAFDRIRQYTTLSYPATWLPGMSSIGVGNEVFLEFDDTRVTINRFYPIRVTFKVNQAKLTPYLMYQTKRVGNTDDWRENWVVGGSGSFSF